jgi:hypothetical protein
MPNRAASGEPGRLRTSTHRGNTDGTAVLRRAMQGGRATFRHFQLLKLGREELTAFTAGGIASGTGMQPKHSSAPSASNLPVFYFRDTVHDQVFYACRCD